jgi:cysteine-rich repeat protein
LGGFMDRKVVVGVLVGLALSLFGSSLAKADCVVPVTFSVTSMMDDGTPGTLRYLLNSGMVHDCDTITIPWMTIKLRLATGALDLDGRPDLDVTKNITIQGAGAGMTVIDGNKAETGDRVFDIHGTDITISGVTIQNGKGIGSGGGILKEGSGALTILNSDVATNEADDGGGISIMGGSLTLSQSTVRDNKALNEGAGGGIEIRAGGAATLTDVTVADNSAEGNGGGIWNGGDLYLINDTIAYNVADKNAGGVTGGDGGGIFNQGEVTLKDSIMAGNNDASPGREAPDCLNGVSSFISGAPNILQDPTGCNITTGATLVLNVDPLFDPVGLKDNGGSTKTIGLQVASPAIDAGDDATCATTDQRGYTRPVGPHCDLGALEATLLTFPPSGVLPTITPSPAIVDLLGYCGDKIVQSALGEQCDDGANNGQTGDGCSATCRRILPKSFPWYQKFRAQ